MAKRIGDATVRMLAYNGSIPGPTLRVAAGLRGRRRTSSTTATWRRPCTGTGCGWTTASTAPTRRRTPIAVGRRLHGYRSRSPTPACTGTTRTSARTTARRWACTATSSSTPPTPTTGRRSTARSPLTLDDILIEDGKVAPFSRSETTLRRDGPLRQRAAGRRRARPGADRRGRARWFGCYLTNTANTRVFKVALPGARMKLVGGDSGRYEREQFVEEVDPGALGAGRRRRAVRPSPGRLTLEHHTPDRIYPLADDHRHRRARPQPSLAEAVRACCAPTRSWSPSASGSTAAARRRAGQDAGVRRRDGHGRARHRRRRGHLRLPDAPRGRPARNPAAARTAA